MALPRTPTSNPNRRPAMRGVVMFDVSNGEQRVRAWPKSRGVKGKEQTKEQTTFMRQASWAMKYFAPGYMQTLMEMRAGMPILPRDVGMMIIANTLFTFSDTEGVKYYSMQTKQAVSDSLDVFSQTPGMILVRGNQFWDATPYPGMPTDTGWINLTFSTPAVTKWNGASFFQADQTIQMQAGDRLEFEIRLKRKAGTETLVALSPEGQHSIVNRRQSDNNYVLYRWDTAGGSPIALNGGLNINSNNWYETFTIATTLGGVVDGMQSQVDSNDGAGLYKAAWIPYGGCDLTGTTKPCWFSSAGGKADIIYARMRKSGQV
jgi:hypothetical protein